MIGQDIANAALEGMNLLFETFSRKGRKMPRITIKTSDKNLIKVASFEGKRKYWCSYWIVPEIPASGVFRVPAGFRFRVGAGSPVDSVLISSAVGTTSVSLAEGDVVILTAPSFKNPNLEHSLEETVYNVDPGLRVVNQAYFKHWWVPAEGDEKSIKALIAKGTLIDSPLENSPSNETAFDNSWTSFTVDYKNPSLVMLHRMEVCLQEQDRAVIDTLNPSKDDFSQMAALMRKHGFVVFENSFEGKAELQRIEDGGYESGYAAAQRALRQVNSDDRERLADAFVKGFEAGRFTEYCKLTGVFTHHDREERESAPKSNSSVGGTFPFTGSVTGRFSSRHDEKVARHAANFRDGFDSFSESESRSHQTTQRADSEQPSHPWQGKPDRHEVHTADGEATPERNENEKDNAQATDSQG